MKRYICVIAMLISAVLLTGCTETLFTTAEYRSYHNFAARHKAGMGKQAVMVSVGFPDAYIDEQGNYQRIAYADRENFAENLLDNSSITWVYECYRVSDPADPYRLVIQFNGEGKSTGVEWYLVPGG